MLKNASWLFDIDYFLKVLTDGTTERDIDLINTAICSQKLSDFQNLLPPPIGIQQIERTIRGTGLTAGLGNKHEVSFERAVKLGFTMDRYSGLPVIRSHLFKGFLRSYFPSKYKGRSKSNYEVRKNYIAHLVKTYGGPQLPADMVGRLEYNIFGKSNSEISKDQRGYKADKSPMALKDAFYDVYPIRSSYHSRLKDKDNYLNHGQFIGTDTILYEGKMNTIKDEDNPQVHKGQRHNTMPNPLKFLKLRAGVDLRFDMTLHDVNLKHGSENCIITKETKLALITHLIDNHPLGAKKSYNFGRLKKVPK